MRRSAGRKPGHIIRQIEERAHLVPRKNHRTSGVREPAQCRAHRLDIHGVNAMEWLIGDKAERSSKECERYLCSSHLAPGKRVRTPREKPIEPK